MSTKGISESAQTCGRWYSCQRRLKVNHQGKQCVSGKPNALDHHPLSEAWWWQHHHQEYFSSAEPTILVRIEGIRNGAKYQHILLEKPENYRELRLGIGYTFQCDNDHKLTAKITLNWFKREPVNVLEWSQ